MLCGEIVWEYSTYGMFRISQIIEWVAFWIYRVEDKSPSSHSTCQSYLLSMLYAVPIIRRQKCSTCINIWDLLVYAHTILQLGYTYTIPTHKSCFLIYLTIIYVKENYFTLKSNYRSYLNRNLETLGNYFMLESLLGKHTWHYWGVNHNPFQMCRSFLIPNEVIISYCSWI